MTLKLMETLDRVENQMGSYLSTWRMRLGSHSRRVREGWGTHSFCADREIKRVGHLPGWLISGVLPVPLGTSGDTQPLPWVFRWLHWRSCPEKSKAR